MAKLDEIYKKMEQEKLQKAENERKYAAESERKRQEFILAEQRLYEKIIITTAAAVAGGGGGGGQIIDTECGCIQFDLNKYIIVEYNEDFNLGTNDFTIEWFQFQLDGSSFPRTFQFGSWPSKLGVSIEPSGDIFVLYFWIDQGVGDYIASLMTSPLDMWVHFAISRFNGITRIYMNGIKINESSLEYNIDVTDIPMQIGVDVFYTGSTYFNGGISNFRFINGTGLYQEDTITVPTSVLQPVENTKLLLQVKSSDTFLVNSGTSKVITNNNSNWNTGNPFRNTSPTI